MGRLKFTPCAWRAEAKNNACGMQISMIFLKNVTDLFKSIVFIAAPCRAPLLLVGLSQTTSGRLFLLEKTID